MLNNNKYLKISAIYFFSIIAVCFCFFLSAKSVQAADTSTPVIVSFVVPSVSSSTTISISAFTATDDIGVTGYLVNESSTAPVLSDSRWEEAATTTYIFTTIGNKTLYAWARDAVGNISSHASGSVFVDTFAPGVSSFDIPPISSSTTISINSLTGVDDYNWSAVLPVGPWFSSAMSSDASVVLAGQLNGRLYLSTTSSNTWLEIRPAGDANKSWFSLAMSSDASVEVAGVNGGRLYISTTTGETWSEVQPAGDINKNWFSTVMSSDGATILTGQLNGRLYLSTTTGNTWSEIRPAGDVNKSWFSLAMSLDGTVMLAGVNNGRLYLSTDSGVTWSEIQPAGNFDKYWFSSDMSADGSTMVIGAVPGRLYISNDTGSTWSEMRPIGDIDKSWFNLKVSDNGSTVFTSMSTGRAYLSDDAGSTWIESVPEGYVNKGWTRGSMSSDGLRNCLGYNGGNFYCGSRDSGNSINGYLVTESSSTPSLYDSNWETTATTSYTFSSPGFKELYAWVRDISGNISLGIEAETLIDVVSPVINNFSIPEFSTSTIVSLNEFIATDDNINVQWAETQPKGNVLEYWRESAMSNDGSILLVGSDDGRLFLSTTSAQSWTEVRPAGNTNQKWYTVSMSGDGSVMLTGVTGGRLYMSTTSGDIWVEVRPAGDTNQPWESSSISDDGSIISVGAFGGRLYVSTTTGNIWTEVRPAGDVNTAWRSSDMSADGLMIMAGITSGRLYLSTTSGATWPEIQPLGNVSDAWRTVAMSSNGTVQIAGTISTGRIYLSTASGATWNEIQPGGDVDYDWRTSSMSADGSVMLVGGASGRLYMSDDTGVTWLEMKLAGDMEKSWILSNISNDGTRLFVADLGGRVYYGQNGPSYLLTESSSTPSINDSNWQKGAPTSYDFSTEGTKTLYAWAMDNAGNISLSISASAIIDTEAPIVSSLSTSTTLTSATISWVTNENATSIIYYGTSTNYGVEISSDVFATSHLVTLPNLISFVTYHYLIVITDQYGHTSTTTDRTFETSGTCPDVSNAASYSSYPNCGAASCISGYILSNSVCIIQGSGGGGYTSPPVFVKSIIAPFKISINDNAETTQSRTVWLSFDTASKAIDYVQLSEDSTFTNIPKNHYEGVMPFTLGEAPGKKRVYVKFYIGVDYSDDEISNTIIYTPQEQTTGTSTEIGDKDDINKGTTTSEINSTTEEQAQKNKEADEMKEKVKALIKKQENEIYSKSVKRIKLEKRLSGRIFLQVEEKGEAWYLNPDDNRRYFLGRPIDIFNVMRRLSLGAAHKYISETTIFPDRLLGKILLDVEDLGRAYYINPIDRKKYYLASPDNAFKVVRELGLGITNENLDLIKAGMLE